MRPTSLTWNLARPYDSLVLINFFFQLWLERAIKVASLCGNSDDDIRIPIKLTFVQTFRLEEVESFEEKEVATNQTMSLLVTMEAVCDLWDESNPAQNTKVSVEDVRFKILLAEVNASY